MQNEVRLDRLIRCAWHASKDKERARIGKSLTYVDDDRRRVCRALGYKNYENGCHRFSASLIRTKEGF